MEFGWKFSIVYYWCITNHPQNFKQIAQVFGTPEHFLCFSQYSSKLGHFHTSHHSKFLRATSCHYLRHNPKFSAQSEHFSLWSHDQDLPLPQLHSITQLHRTLFPFIETVYDNVWAKFQVIPFNIYRVIQETLQIYSTCSQNCATSSRTSVTWYSQRTKQYNIAHHSHPNDLKFSTWWWEECSLSVPVWHINRVGALRGGNLVLFVKLLYMVIHEALGGMAPKFSNGPEIYVRYVL